MDNGEWSKNMLAVVKEIHSREEQDDTVNSLYKALYIVLNAISQAEHSDFSDYPYLLMSAQVSLLIKFLKNDQKKIVMEEMAPYSEDDYRGIFEFINSIYNFIHAINHSNHTFIQDPDFDMNVYDIPVKLGAFYISFIYKVKQFLAELESDTGAEYHPFTYEFLLSAELYTSIYVKALFFNRVPEDRLLIIKIPECDLYRHTSMIQIMHEITHFVGNTLRCRKERGQLACRTIIEIIIQSIRFAFLDQGIEISDSCFQQISENIMRYFNKRKSEYLSDFMKEKKYSRFTQEKKQDYFYYANELSSMLTDILESLVSYESGLIFDPIKDFILGLDVIELSVINRKLQVSHEYDTEIDMINNILKHLEDLIPETGRRFMGSDTVYQPDGIMNLDRIRSISYSIQFCFNLYKESYSDLVTILTLRLTISEYISCFAARPLAKETSLSSPLFLYRSAALIKVLFEQDAAYRSEYDRLADGLETADRYGYEGIRRVVLEKMLHLHEDKPETGRRETAPWYLYSDCMFDDLCQYVKGCYLKYGRLCEKSDSSRKRNELNRLYTAMKNGSNKEKFDLVFDEIAEYRRKLSEVNRLYVEELT